MIQVGAGVDRRCLCAAPPAACQHAAAGIHMPANAPHAPPSALAAMLSAPLQDGIVVVMRDAEIPDGVVI